METPLIEPNDLEEQQDRQQALQIIEEQEIRLLEADLYSYLIDAWPILQPFKPFRPNWHIEAICDHLQAVTEGHIKNLVINIPPRHLKSNIVSVFWPSWHWIHDPSFRWLYMSYGRDLVLRDAVSTRSLLQGHWFRSRWGDRFALSSDQNVKSYFTNDKGGARLTASFESDPTGEGGDGLVIDDPLRISDAHNNSAIKHVNEIYDGTLATRLNDPVKGIKVMIMQRLNENDLTGHVLREGGWTHLYLPTEYESRRKCVVFFPADLNEEGKPKDDARPFFFDPRKEDGQLLHPERFPRAEVDKLKRKGDLHFAGQQQQRPVPLGGNLFKSEWFNFYTQLPNFDAIYGDGCISVDCSFKDLAASSYVVMTVWVRVDARIYLVYRLREKLNFPNTLKRFKSIVEMFPWAGAKYIEDKANGPAVIQTVQGLVSGVIAVPAKDSKESRAAAVTYLVQAGNVYLPHESIAPWVTGEYIPELTSFPNGEYDDQVDSTTMALFHHFHLRPVAEIPLLEMLEIGKNEPMNGPRYIF